MSLRTKVVVGLAVVAVLALALQATASEAILVRGFDRLEEQDIRDKTEQAHYAVGRELANLEATTADWAHWDDTYQFIEDGNAAYIDSNLGNPTFVNNRLSFVAYVHSSSRLVYGAAFNARTREQTPLPASLERHLRPDGPLFQRQDPADGVSGLLVLQEGPALVASHAILTSDKEGPARGTLIFGRYLDDDELQLLRETVRLNLTIHPLDSSDASPDFRDVQPLLKGDGLTAVKALSDDIIAGYELFKDIEGQPALIMRVEAERAIHKQNQSTLLYFVVSRVVTWVLFIGLILFMLEWLVLSRLARLTSGVHRIGRSGDLSARLSVTGKDEIAQLGGAVNGMLEALEKAQEERRRAAQELLETHEALQAVVQSSPLAIIATDPQGIVKMWNPAAEHIFGWTAEEALGKPLPMMPAEQQDDFRSFRELAVKGGMLTAVETRLLRKDGMLTDVSISMAAMRDASGRVTGIISIAEDIAARKEAEARLEHQLQVTRAHAERDQALAQGFLSIGVAPLSEAISRVLDLTATVTGVQYVAFFRYDEAAKVLTFDRTNRTEVPEFTEEARRVLVFPLGEERGLVGLVGATGKPVYVPDCSKEPRWVTIRPEYRSAYMVAVGFRGRLFGVMRLLSEQVDGISPEARSMADTVAAYAGAVLENSRLFTLERERVQLLQEVDRMRTDFLGMVSHQLKTPITAIKAALSLLQEVKSSTATPASRRLTANMERSVRALEQLVSDLLDFAKVRAGQLTIERAPTELQDMVRETTGLLSASLQAKEQRLVVDMPREPVVATVDSHRLGQVLVNLLSNASKYSPPGSTIRLKLERRADEAVLSVSDNCGGIPEDVQPYLFEAYRVPRGQSSESAAAGSGLGLTIAKGLVELHGGRLWFDNHPGQGCTFTFSVPMNPSQAAANTQQSE